MLGIIACLILIACGSDQNAGAGNSPQATQNGGFSSSGDNNGFATAGGNNTSTNGNVAASTSASGGTVQAVSQTGAQAPANQTVPLTPTGFLNQDVRSVIKAVRPSVVEVIAETSSTSNIGSIFGNGDQSGGQTGIGTGSIISPSGYILTNNHVVEGANKFTVVLPDGRQYDATLIGREGKVNDIAVIKIDPSQNGNQPLPVMKLGDSSKLEIGEAVVAIGNALGLEGGPSVTQGIVSAMGRSIQEPNGAQLTALIQTDAAINPGNSGGPLLNLRGEQIGINTAAPVDPSQGVVANGIGFAININQVMTYIQPFVGANATAPAQGQQGQATQPAFAGKPFMGILPQTVTAGLAAQYKLPVKQGALIGRVDPNTPAQAAGWQAGDVIIKMDGTDIKTIDDLAAVLARHKPGDTVSTTLVNLQGQQRTTNITFSKSPNS